jgi:hypothetical protein
VLDQRHAGIDAVGDWVRARGYGVAFAAVFKPEAVKLLGRFAHACPE